MRVPVARAVACAFISLSATADLAFAGQAAPACGGRDLVAQMATNSPRDHARLVREADAVQNGGALLWRVVKPGHKPSYLFGTIHMTDSRVTTLSGATAAALDGADHVAVEIAGMSDGVVMKAVAANPRALVFTDGRRLERMLDEREFEAVSQTLARIGVPTPARGQIRPWLVAMLLAVSDCERARMAERLPVLDQLIEQRAGRNGTPVTGLETVEAQIAAMASVPDGDQLAVLKSTLQLAGRFDDMRETLLQLYLSRRIGGVLALQRHFATKAGLAADATHGFEHNLISRRNHTMHASARPLVARGGAFIAVGAAHLVGDDGLVALMRKDGYWVTPVE